MITVNKNEERIMNTQCNYCSLKAMRKKAKVERKRVTVLSDAAWGMGGFNVYVHPLNVNIRKLTGGEDGTRKKYRCAWMHEIGKHCSC